MTVAIRVVIVVAIAATLLALVGMIPAAAIVAPDGASEALAIAQQANGDGGTDVWTVVMWTLIGVAGFAVVLSVLYGLKRRVGGFPENPTWVAPITIMPAGENATEETFGTADEHDDHGSHH